MIFDDIEACMQHYRALSTGYASAEAERQHLEDFKKSKLAALMKDAELVGVKTSAAQERDALASDDKWA